ARAAAYFVVFVGTALLMRALSARQDRDASDALVTRLRGLSAALLPPVAFALTFGAIDWFMSLEPTWTSTVYGIYWWVGGFVAAIAVITLLDLRAPLVRPPPLYAMGRLLFAFTIFWTYISYAQGFIIWIGNRPDDVTWYVLRTHGSWAAVAV